MTKVGADVGVACDAVTRRRRASARSAFCTDQNVVFWTDDVEKTWKELSTKGVTFGAPPKKEPWGTYTTFQDPDGNRFVLGTK